MRIRPSEIPDILIIEPRVFADSRGFFFEVFHRDRLREAGITAALIGESLMRSGEQSLLLRSGDKVDTMSTFDWIIPDWPAPSWVKAYAQSGISFSPLAVPRQP